MMTVERPPCGLRRCQCGAWMVRIPHCKKDAIYVWICRKCRKRKEEARK